MNSSTYTSNATKKVAMNTIGLDCRLSGLKHAGIGRYILNLAQRLPLLAPDLQWVYFIYDTSQAKELFPEETPTNVTFIPAPIKHYSLSEQFSLPKLFRSAKLGLLHVPHFNVPFFYGGSTVMTIHDLLWHHHRGESVTTLSGWRYWLKYAGYRLIVTSAIQKARAIIVPTESIKEAVKAYYPQVTKKITVTLEGIDEQLKATKPISEKALDSALRSKTLLYVGSLYPHKNLQVAIKALKKLPHYQLKIVGARSIFRSQIEKEISAAGVEEQVTFLGFVPDKELQELYRNSTALVQPSLSEGFGLTGLEALASGGRVLASDIPIFHEVYKNAATFFDPHSPDSLVQAVEKVTTQTIKATTIQKVLATYSWDTMAQKTLAVYRNLLSL